MAEEQRVEKKLPGKILIKLFIWPIVILFIVWLITGSFFSDWEIKKNLRDIFQPAPLKNVWVGSAYQPDIAYIDLHSRMLPMIHIYGGNYYEIELPASGAYFWTPQMRDPVFVKNSDRFTANVGSFSLGSDRGGVAIIKTWPTDYGAAFANHPRWNYQQSCSNYLQQLF